jgi:glutaredoxin
MTDDSKLILYTRPGCHLCEPVAEMLERLGADWQAVNIEKDPELEQRYGVRIPVVFCPRSKKELPFPIREEQLMALLEGC